MVVYVPDKTGRFARRPHYEPKELDRECEGIVGTYLKEKYGRVEFPVSTEDLTVIIEREVESLDQYADLTEFGPKVEGITYFQPGRRPRVAISQASTIIGPTGSVRRLPMSMVTSTSTPISGRANLPARTY